MIKIFQKNRGVTLIELVVVMAILGIMAAITTTSYNAGKIKRDVETNAREFAAVLRLAQNYALSGKQSGSQTCGYRVESVAPSSYSIIPLSFNTNNCITDGTAIESYTLKYGVIITTTNAKVTFLMPYGTIGSGSDNQITFSKGSVSQYVCVATSGEIKYSTNPC